MDCTRFSWLAAATSLLLSGCAMCASPYDYCGPTFTDRCGPCMADERMGSVLGGAYNFRQIPVREEAPPEGSTGDDVPYYPDAPMPLFDGPAGGDPMTMRHPMPVPFEAAMPMTEAQLYGKEAEGLQPRSSAPRGPQGWRPAETQSL